MDAGLFFENLLATTRDITCVSTPLKNSSEHAGKSLKRDITTSSSYKQHQIFEHTVQKSETISRTWLYTEVHIHFFLPFLVSFSVLFFCDFPLANHTTSRCWRPNVCFAALPPMSPACVVSREAGLGCWEQCGWLIKELSEVTRPGAAAGRCPGAGTLPVLLCRQATANDLYLNQLTRQRDKENAIIYKMFYGCCWPFAPWLLLCCHFGALRLCTLETKDFACQILLCCRRSAFFLLSYKGFPLHSFFHMSTHLRAQVVCLQKLVLGFLLHMQCSRSYINLELFPAPNIQRLCYPSLLPYF